MQTFNTSPYYDDFDKYNEFYRILFVPSLPVQARELTQLQTILQTQIRNFADNIFEQGAMVIPGQASVETSADTTGGTDYVKLQSTYNGINIETYLSELQGTVITGTSGLSAQVIMAVSAEGNDEPTLYIRYLSSGDDTVTKVFSDSEVLSTEDGAYVVRALGNNATGKGSTASIAEGIYYINGFFPIVTAQTIILDKYSTSPSYRVGLLYNDSIITSEDDDNLKDNATGSSNYAAPGAHRYKIDLKLSKLAIDSEDDDNFIELIRVVDGKVNTIVDTSDYSEIVKTLARRTYDESGDYKVRGLGISVREHRSNDRGEWKNSVSYLRGDVVTSYGNTYVAVNSATSGSNPPMHTSGEDYDGTNNSGINWRYTVSPYYNNGVYTVDEGGDESKLAIGIESGKAYVRGYEIKKVATTYIPVDKARTVKQVSNNSITSTVGNYVLVTNLAGTPPISNFGTVNLHSKMFDLSNGIDENSIIGTARVSFVEWHDGIPYDKKSIYKLGLFDINLNSGYSFSSDVKTISYLESFTANISPITAKLSGSIFSGSISSPSSSTTLQGSGTSFLTDVSVGDYILVTSGGTEHICEVTGVSNQQEITIGTEINVSGATAYLLSTKLYDTSKNSLLFYLHNNAIKSVTSSSGNNETNYTVYQTFTTTASETTANITTTGTFLTADSNDNYIVIGEDGNIINPVSITVSSSSCTITLPSANSGETISVIAPVHRAGINLKSKTLKSHTQTVASQSDIVSGTIFLEHPDIYGIVSIMMDSGTFENPTGDYTIDISDRYDLDNGQRNMFYDLGRINLSASYATPSAPIQITYKYFYHSAGDYFTVDSYTDLNYDEIPAFLRDSIDFRPTVSKKSDAFPSTFTGASADITVIPKRGELITADWSYYLPRVDKIALNSSGTLFDVKGTPSLSPESPTDPALSMILYNLNLAAYTMSESDDNGVSVVTVNNKRYTMKDIGKLDTRISNLEETTALSLLETSTAALSVTDDDGNTKYKNGFVVDNFSTTTGGETSSPDFNCSIDTANGILRPFYTMGNVNLIEKNSTDAQRADSNYQISGDIIHLPIVDEPVMIAQNYGSRLENINPFAIYTFLGAVELTPESDDWFETETAPDIVNQVEGNYSALKTIARESGALGIKWGAWKTNWTGVSTTSASYNSGNPSWAASTYWKNPSAYTNISTSDMQSIAGYRGNVHGSRQVTVNTYNTTSKQTRTGTKYTIQENIDYEVVGTKVIATSVIPYIRSRNILIQSYGLKPDTTFYPYFDSTLVTEYCTPASKIVYTINDGTFTDTMNAGGNADESARQLDGDTLVCLTSGDVITGQNSGATAVVVGVTIEGNSNVLQVFNVKGTFDSDELITGSLSGATGIFKSISVSTSISTNSRGELNLLFKIPNNSKLSFRTGSREFMLSDASTASGDYTSRGIATYEATGVLETEQTTINAVRNASIVQEQVTSSRTVSSTSSSVVSDTGWYDPLAQSFYVDQKGGAFITEVDVYFASKDDNIPVTLQIRNMNSGSPGSEILAFGSVTLYPENVNISDNTVTLNGAEVPSYDTPTPFRFSTPIFVEEGEEYCFVLKSDSDSYKVWIATMGDTIPNTSRTISKQPYNGVMFESQNASTWTADQNSDIKFQIKRAKFATEDDGVISSVEFVNGNIDSILLEENPIQTAKGSNVIRVWHPNHGMPTNSRVTLRGFTKDVNGIDYNVLNNTFQIGIVDNYWYEITLDEENSATSSGYSGGNSVYATRNIAYDIMHPTIQYQTFSETTSDFTVKTTSGTSINGNQTPYQIDDNWSEITNDTDIAFYEPKLVASKINQTKLLSDSPSLLFNLSMSTTNDSLSPMIDTGRASAILINNVVNNPAESTTNIAELDSVELYTGTGVSFSENKITTSNINAKAAFSGISIGKYLEITGTTNNNKSFMITDYTETGNEVIITVDGNFVNENSNSGTTISYRQMYADSISPSGSYVVSKYITKAISLENQSTYIKFIISQCTPQGSDIKVYYRATTGDSSALTNLPFTEISPSSPIPMVSLDSADFTDISFNIDDLDAFNIVQIKVEMISTNSCAVPKITDLRAIFCA